MDFECLGSDEYQFSQFKSGKEPAFEYFFNLYYNNIVGFSIQFIGDRDKANSITQDAFIKLWLNRRKVQKLNGIKSFLYTSAKTDCLNLLRHKNVVQRYASQKLYEQENNLNKEILDAMDFDSLTLQELEEMIDRAIQDLPERSKRVFIKKRIENKKNKQIAFELGISEKAVEANMTRAIKLLKLRLSNYIFVLILTSCNLIMIHLEKVPVF